MAAPVGHITIKSNTNIFNDLSLLFQWNLTLIIWGVNAACYEFIATWNCNLYVTL